MNHKAPAYKKIPGKKQEPTKNKVNQVAP